MVSGRTRRRSLIRLAGAAALATLVPERRAAASPLPADDLARLTRGEVLRRELDLELPSGDYFGGLSYAVIHAPVAEVMAVIADPGTYRTILPMTMEVRTLSRSGRDVRVLLRQGGSLGSAGYVLLTRRESQGLLRFWLDPREPHEIADCWGYFRVQPWESEGSLLTYAALLQLDPGLVKLLFKETIRRLALGTPGLVRAYVHARHGGEP
jgi:hypothetical protein